MKAMELARRIGNIDDELVSQGKTSGKRCRRRKKERYQEDPFSVAGRRRPHGMQLCTGGLRYERRAGDDRNRRCGDYADSS